MMSRKRALRGAHDRLGEVDHLIAARPASTMRQYMIASTVTEAPSLVSVCSAMNGVVVTRMSMVNGVCSMYGSRKKIPGPRTPPKRPKSQHNLAFPFAAHAQGREDR